MNNTHTQAEVRPHPAGGWTIARPEGSGTVRIYDGQFATQEAAAAALAGPPAKARAA